METSNPSLDKMSDSSELAAHQSEVRTNQKFDLNVVLSKLSKIVGASGISIKKEQEIRLLRQEIKENHETLKQYKLILSCIKDVTNKADVLSPAVAQKVKRILSTEQAAQLFQNCSLDCYPLGLSDKCMSNKDYELLYVESRNLQLAVEDTLVTKCCNIKEREKQSMRYHEGKTLLLKLNNDLEKAMLEYNESIMKAFNILKEICDHVVPVAKINASRVECLVKEIRATEFKAKVLECKQNHKIYSENKNILPCIEKIDTSLKLEMESLSHKLKELRNLKMKYDKISEMDEYRQVLREYQEVKKSVHDKRWLLSQC